MSPAAVGAAAGMLVVVALVAARTAHVQRRRAVAAARLPARDGGLGSPGDAGSRWLLHPPHRVSGLLRDAGLPVDPSVAWTAWCASTVVVTGLASWAVGVGLASVALATAGGLGGLVTALRRGSTGRLVEGSLPDALERLASAMRGGAGTLQGLGEVAATTAGPLGVELRQVVAEVGRGATLEGALQRLQHRQPEPGVSLAVVALLLGAEAGGAHARALEGVAASVRSRLGVVAEVSALGSQARLSAFVIAAAPLGFAGLAVGTDRTSATFLLRTPLGLACLALGLALDGVGAWWMHRVARVEA